MAGPRPGGGRCGSPVGRRSRAAATPLAPEALVLWLPRPICTPLKWPWAPFESLQPQAAMAVGRLRHLLWMQDTQHQPGTRRRRSHSAGGRPGPIPHPSSSARAALETSGALQNAGAQAQPDLLSWGWGRTQPSGSAGPPWPVWWWRARPVAGSRGASASTPGPAEAARNAGMAEGG